MARHENRLIAETSPYLLQHAHNPVDWFPWGPEALEKAKTDDKPILLSIGYSACHWCHVMERESFENEEIAALMNERFVCIKVDREERPDIDDIYMHAVQILTRSGGWPLTVFLTPDLKPFYGGTYFPPEDRWGRPGFRTVLTEIARLYQEQRGQVDATAGQLTEHLQELAFTPASPELLAPDLLRAAVRELSSRFDPRDGGFSPAPKFPPSGALFLLLRFYHAHEEDEALQMARLTLDKMAAGGMYDQLGGGFHRYSTDARWLVPHFEKMLYDNALLARAYLEAFQVTGEASYARVARETLEYVLREMQGKEGGYYSSQDADSEGVEGKFFVWSKAEITELLGDGTETFCRIYDVTETGNWEGSNVLNRLRSEPQDFDANAETIDKNRRALFDAREKRVKPGLDDKVLTSWNGLMIIAMARGYRVLGEPSFLASAQRAARFAKDTLFEKGRLLATYRAGRAKLLAYLDDYAFLMGGLIELYESDFDVGWLDEARRLADEMVRLFWDAEDGGFFFTGSDHESLILRSKSGHDGAIPAGNAVAATYLFKLATYTGWTDYETRAQETLHTFHAQMRRAPSGFAQMLCALDYYLADQPELAVVGSADAPATRDALQRIWRLFTPNAAIGFLDPAWPNREEVEKKAPLLQGKTSADGSPRFYVCENYTCQAPTEKLDDAIAALRPRH
ncbi:MAG TPA: thioredoxin domain-containing protein [Vicinamibacteria bacterium]